MELRITGMSKTYSNGVRALDGVSLTIPTGMFGLLGPNGSGKTTLMRTIATLQEPDEGSARLGDVDVLKEKESVRRVLGYLPQEFGAWRLHRVEEVVDALALLSGLSDGARRRARVAAVLESVGLDQVADRKVKALSGGMTRRLGVAQALVHEPRVLIVDEPTVGLDPEERVRFRQLMASLGQERTIVLSTHIVADLGPGCHDVALIDRGRVVFRGSPAELAESARGRVFEIDLSPGSEDRLGADVEIVARQPHGASLRVRGASASGELPAGAAPVAEPTLEEGYLVFMARRGRVEAALAEDA